MSNLRLKRRHSGRHAATGRPAIDGRSLVDGQNLSSAAAAGVAAVAIGAALWVALAMVFDRYFPWFSVFQGVMIGRAVQRAGNGIEWPFPALAAALASAAAFIGSFCVALFLTGREFRTGALPLVQEISWHTVATFAVKNFAVVGVIYMIMAAIVAAFYSTRRLNRQEAIALRRFRERQQQEPVNERHDPDLR
jgi:hypothetical protein